MAENDVYNNKRRYENFKNNLILLLEPPDKKYTKYCKYYCKNPKNLKYLKRLFEIFDAKDISYIRRNKICMIVKLILTATNKDLAEIDIEVQRNAFGRQKESFEKSVEIKGFSKPYHAVFIRAPVIKKVFGACEILAKIDKKIVAARQDKFLAFSFHPELTDDLRLHQYFLRMFI